MNLYKEINREITLKNQELKTILATRTSEVNYLQCELLRCREENKALRTLIMDVVRKNSQEYNRLLEAITGEFGDYQQPQHHQQESKKSQCSNRQSTRLSKSFNVSTKSNRSDPLRLALAQNRKSLSFSAPSKSPSPSLSYNGNHSFNDNDNTYDNNDNDDKKVDKKCSEEMLLQPMITRRRLSKSKNINDRNDHQDENVENIQPNVIQNLTPPTDTDQRSYGPLSIINESNESLAQTQLSSKSFAGRKSTKLYESFKPNQSGCSKKNLTTPSSSLSSSSPKNFVQMTRRQCILQQKSIEFATIARLSTSELIASSTNDDSSSSFNDNDKSWTPEKKASIKIKKKHFVTVTRGTKNTKERSLSSSTIIQNLKRKRYAKLLDSDSSSESSSSMTDNEKTPTKDELSAALVAHSTPIPLNRITSRRTRRSLTAKINNDNVAISEKRSSGRCFTPKNKTIKEETPELTKTGRIKRKAAPKCLKEPPTHSKLRRE